MSKHLEAKSKFLSLVLRHKPGVIGLELDPHGWADVNRLVELATAHGTPLSRELVEEIVATSDKQRFALTPDRKRIRANQGHSVEVDLQLAPVRPPPLLFHGTASRFLAAIRDHGLMPRSRRHVHLSDSEATAATVGARHGRPVVLRVASEQMHAHGYHFYRSANGVWLTATVPVHYLDGPTEA
ncbi:putative RNA 2'-phosphotransferase [Lysobacter bugurensis]|uniref:Probable RNA 2'-phosphotransferase n=2 Tax=Cognatilysobacter bugurensis TaxID=543356 RepID=A0A918SWL7_9GAMM|nr:RNA 2'-phosphotransferase [Lysobacter bugurensis]GHA72743.1 putative RNA 2'-phosphotransferase [Lysobacter bugurensis]